MFNEITCPEVEDLMDAFQSMTTIIKFGNQTLESGNLDAAHKNYCDALFLFTKLNNGRGVSLGYLCSRHCGSKSDVLEDLENTRNMWDYG